MASDSAPPLIPHPPLIFLDGYISISAYKGMTPFEAIAEPNRRQILDLLRGGERPAGALVEATGLSQPGVSKHLKLLREAGLVSVRPDGQRRLYRLEPGELAELDEWLKPFRRFWAERLNALDEHLEKEQ
ncbi:MAG TPA: metalloregulator ArsR/SmtB family transcription factor [Phenylobacterium sp.]|jgi:DNA-binding transcriptional ArsR family regulator|nr:metalloregulator ArsR/SmtB family transcription factor [Phenylobacterium sp.]